MGKVVTAVCARDEVFVAAPVADVWQVVADVAGYVCWWPRALGLRVITGGLIGAEVEIKPYNGGAFRCKVTAADPPRSMTMEYLGFVRGRGEWILTGDEAGTRVVYALDTVAEGWPARLVGLFIDLGDMHSAQMRKVFDGMKRRLRGAS